MKYSKFNAARHLSLGEFMVGEPKHGRCVFQILTLVTLILCSCAKKSDTQEAQGDLRVQIGIQSSASSYALQVVQLNGISNLSEVAGSYAQFFYSPGSTATQITGSAPHAYFIHSQNFFVPTDVLSMQMATIYYHLQNLAQFDKEIGADGINHWPRSVGLNTQIIDGKSGVQKNNAFYNGETDSMIFVPFTKGHLPIAVNAGIIAHEHFHSLFYKVVILPAAKFKKIKNTTASVHADEQLKVRDRTRATKKMGVPEATADEDKVQLFNETYLRGINEGFADFWGWLYTDDPEFMRWSLPEYQADRTLQLSDNKIGIYETKENILNKVNEAQQMSDNPQGDLVNYAYQVGTPYARFLKQFTLLQADSKNISIKDSKKLMAEMLLNYIKELSIKVQSLQENDTLDPLSLFEYVAKLSEENNLIHMDQTSCQFLIKYLNLNEDNPKKQNTCKEIDPVQKGQKDSSFVVVKP